MALRRERCQCQYGSCTTLSVMKSGATTATDVHLAQRRTMLQPNAHYESQTRERPSVHTEARPSERAQPAGTLSADSVTSDWKLQQQKGNDVQHGMAQQSGFGLIWQFTGGEKRSGKQENDLVALMRGFFSGAAWIHTYNHWSNKATFRHHNTQKTGKRNVLKRKRKAFCRLNKYLQPRGRSLCAESSDVCCCGRELDNIIIMSRRGFL